MAIDKTPSRLAEMARQANEDSHRWFPATADDIFFITAAMAGESGEAVNKLKKIYRGDTKMTPALRHEYVMELTDVLTYLLDAFALMGADPERTYYQKRAINEGRFGKK